MTTEQQDWNDDQRRIQLQAQKPQQTGLYELVQRTNKGDFRESWVEEQTISIHTTEAGAYKAGLKPNFIVRPLKVKD